MLDDSERAAAGTLPDDPEADTELMPAPGLSPTLGSFIDEAFERMRARKRGEEKPITLPWGTLSEALHGGLWPGMYVLVGNTGTGKTQWCFQLAIEAARAGTPVLYVALESDRLGFASRCLGYVAETPWNYLSYGDHPVLERVQDAHREALKALPLHVEFASAKGWNYSQITTAVEALRLANPGSQPILVVLDYLQIVGAANDREDLRARIGNASSAAADVARTQNAAVLLVSSTARANYDTVAGRGKDTPLGEGSPTRLVGLGKESGEIEFNADGMFVLAREEGNDVVWLAVAKGRALTKPAWVELRFNGWRFSEPPGKAPLPGAPTR